MDRRKFLKLIGFSIAAIPMVAKAGLLNEVESLSEFETSPARSKIKRIKNLSSLKHARGVYTGLVFIEDFYPFGYTAYLKQDGSKWVPTYILRYPELPGKLPGQINPMDLSFPAII